MYTKNWFIANPNPLENYSMTTKLTVQLIAILSEEWFSNKKKMTYFHKTLWIQKNIAWLQQKTAILRI